MNGIVKQPSTKHTDPIVATDKPQASAVQFRVNAFKLNLSKAQIYKYVIVFHGADFSHNEKKVLANAFLTQVGTEPTAPDVVFDGYSKFFLPILHSRLLQKSLYATFRACTKTDQCS